MKDNDCEFCNHRTYGKSICIKHKVKVFIDSKSCTDWVGGGPCHPEREWEYNKYESKQRIK